jgi:predicted phage-related endonuclease
VKVGELVTPTGRLVLPPERLGGDEWLEKRRWRKEVPGGYCIGSSEVPSILDLEGVDTPAHIYRRKVYNIDTPVNEAMWAGSGMEGAIAMMWAQRNRAVIDEIGLVSNVDRPWRQTTIDRRVRECPVYRGTEKACLLEIKLVGHASAKKWKRDVPDRVLAQIIDQLMVTGYDHAHYAALVSSTHLAQGIIYADRERKLMAYVDAEVERFRTEHLLAGVEPPWSEDKPDKMIDLDNATHPEREGSIELDTEGVGEVMAYAEVVAQLGRLGKRKKQLAAELRRLANGAAVAKFSDELAYWYRMDNRAPAVDLDLLKERWPDAYEACVTAKSSPTLVVGKSYKVEGDEG